MIESMDTSALTQGQKASKSGRKSNSTAILAQKINACSMVKENAKERTKIILCTRFRPSEDVVEDQLSGEKKKNTTSSEYTLEGRPRKKSILPSDLIGKKEKQ